MCVFFARVSIDVLVCDCAACLVFMVDVIGTLLLGGDWLKNDSLTLSLQIDSIRGYSQQCFVVMLELRVLAGLG